MKFYLSVIALCAFSFTHITAAKAIYGDDNRIDIREASPEIQELARSTVVMIKKSEFTQKDNLWVYNYPFNTLAYEMDLTPSERFAKQIPQGHCSGSLISSDEILTALHCVKRSFNDIMFVFDFKLDARGVTPVFHKQENVYRAVSIRHSPKVGDGYVIVKLDRPVIGRVPLILTSKTSVSRNNLFTIHYPSGLPAKYSDEGWVKDSYYSYEYKTYIFDHNLDTFGGSSGAPIFDRKTNKVIGVLMDGDEDYKKKLIGRRNKPATYSLFARNKYERAIFVNTNSLIERTKLK